MPEITIVNCPTCAKAVEWNTQNTFRPFCSQRCKLIDLGEWASETRVIAGKTLDEEFDAMSSELEKHL